MEQIEVVKVVINGGSFGLIAIGVVWLLWYGIPTIERISAKIEDRHAATISQMEETHAETIRHLTETCREERREAWAAYVAESKADRDSRHETASRFQAILNDTARRPGDGSGTHRPLQ